MWLVSVSVMLAVVQCASSAGGSPRLPTRSTPPFDCASAAKAAPATTSRTAITATNAFRTGTERAMRVPPWRVSGRVGRLCSGAGALVNARVVRRGGMLEPPEGHSFCPSSARKTRGYGYVRVVPSPVPVTVNVPAVLDAYPYAPQAGVPPGGGAGTEAMKGPALWLRPLTAAAVRSVRAAGNVPMWAV